MPENVAVSSSRTAELWERAQALIPGGVNSPVRAFKSVGGDPVFFASAQGAYLVDVDGNRYVDYVGAWGGNTRHRSARRAHHRYTRYG